MVPFLRYFTGYLFSSRTRQKLLFFAILGLLLSSFALLVLQSVMGGLQQNLISRSQKVNGSGLLVLKRTDVGFAETILELLQKKKIEAYAEYEIELLLRHENFLSPAILHGVERSNPQPFLQDKDLSGIVLGTDLADKVQGGISSRVQLISPAHTDSIMGDVPRQTSSVITDYLSSQVADVDLYHAWTNILLVQNLIRGREYNRIRLFGNYDPSFLEDLLELYPDEISFKSWESLNASLVWALNLESKAMLFLFICMGLLVTVAITSGFMIFFEKIKVDLASFWILGSSPRKLDRMCAFFLHFISFLTIILGLGLAVFFLYLLENHAEGIMPSVFVDRNIPVLITAKGVLISFAVPYLIAVTFSYYTLRMFRQENKSFIEITRAHQF